MFYRVESIGKQTLFKSFISHVLKQQILISLHKYSPESAFNLICKYLHDFATDYFYVLNKLLKKINLRVVQMIKKGAILEVKKFIKLKVPKIKMPIKQLELKR